MEKRKYVSPEMEILEFEEDVDTVVVSVPTGDDQLYDENPVLPLTDPIQNN